jgi:hypothetical protein
LSSYFRLPPGSDSSTGFFSHGPNYRSSFSNSKSKASVQLEQLPNPTRQEASFPCQVLSGPDQAPTQAQASLVTDQTTNPGSPTQEAKASFQLEQLPNPTRQEIHEKPGPLPFVSKKVKISTALRPPVAFDPVRAQVLVAQKKTTAADSGSNEARATGLASEQVSPSTQVETDSLAPEPDAPGYSTAAKDGTPSFEDRIVELQEYYDEHCHLRVPGGYMGGRGKGLGAWVAKLRRKYKGPCRVGDERPGLVLNSWSLTAVRIKRL